MSVVESKLRTRLATLTPTTLELNDDSAAHAGHAGAAPAGRADTGLAVRSGAGDRTGRLANLRHGRSPSATRNGFFE